MGSLDLIDSPIEQNYSRRFWTNKMGLWARKISASEEILTPMCRTYLHDWRVTLKNGGKVTQLLLPLLMTLFFFENQYVEFRVCCAYCQVCEDNLPSHW